MESSEDENSYRNIIKGTSVFGGVQIIQVLISLIRGKFVAILLGAEGMGINTLYTTATNTVQQFASLGLNMAIVKEIAASDKDSYSFNDSYRTSQKLILATSLFGAILCLILSPFLSEWSFGNKNYTGAFCCLSFMVFLVIQSSGQLSILQGLHEIKKLALSSLVSGGVGLLLGIPLYYLWGFYGIVPSMILQALSLFIFYRIVLNKTIRGKITYQHQYNIKKNMPLIKKLVSLGLVLVCGTLIGSLTNYIITTFIRTFGSVDNVGYYQAANSITNQYVGLIFSAMAMDYFPRLSKVAGNNQLQNDIVNRQTEIIGFILTPLVILVIATAPVIIKILLTDSFLTIIPLVKWMALGILFKGFAYPMGYITFANDNKRLFFILEGVWGNVVNLVLSFVLYYFYGLIGIGIAICLVYTISVIVYYIVNHHYYEYRYSSKSLRIIVYAIIFGSTSFGTSFISNHVASYTLMAIIFCISCLFSFRKLKEIYFN